MYVDKYGDRFQTILYESKPKDQTNVEDMLI